MVRLNRKLQRIVGDAATVSALAPLHLNGLNGAQHGVPEVWVLDLAGGVVRRFAQAKDGVYTDVGAVRPTQPFTLPGLPACQLDLADVF